MSVFNPMGPAEIQPTAVALRVPFQTADVHSHPYGKGPYLYTDKNGVHWLAGFGPSTADMDLHALGPRTQSPAR
jgi:hypothetical protein